MNRYIIMVLAMGVMLISIPAVYTTGYTDGRVYECALNCPGRVAKLINDKCHCITYTEPTSRSPRWLAEEETE